MNDQNATEKRRARYEQSYIIFVGLFIAALVSCNLIFKKFFSISVPIPFFGDYDFHQSVGILPYPLTFLITDILSEVYGRKRANQAVLAGFFASLFVIIVLLIADHAPAASWSVSENGGVDNKTFHLVFGTAWLAFLASMAAYLVAQYLDIRLFHFWRRLTHGKHLWLRNNASTIASQVVDTGLVLVLLAAFKQGGVNFDILPQLFLNGILFKMSVALLDTPFFYGAVFTMRRFFSQEIEAVHRTDGTA
jgi:uncharacterized integral membrane protein (TIGR00697 family)